MAKVFLQHNGQPHLPPEKQRPFRLPGWRFPIPVGGRIEVTEHMLRTLSRPLDQPAEDFATYIAGVYNANRTPDMLSVVVEGDGAPAQGGSPPPEQPPTQAPEQGAMVNEGGPA